MTTAAAHWYPVQPIVGPQAGAPAGLHLHGVEPGPLGPTPVGERHAIVVPAGATADLGAYANAFAAAQWRERTGAAWVRLRIRVDAEAEVAVLASDAAGAVRTLERRPPAAGETVVEVPLAGIGGLLWCTVRAGDRPVVVEDAAWEVREAPQPGALVIGTPTVGRVDDVAGNLGRIAAAPALLEPTTRVLVIDHAPAPIAPAVEARAGEALGGRLRVVRQPNIGGSGGYSRIMHEAQLEPGASHVLLLDDDIVLDPAVLLVAFEFGRRTTRSDVIGLQMLDAARPGVLDAAAERISGRTFWWAPADPRVPGTDAAAPLASVPQLHAPEAADFAPWWGSLVPIDAVRAVGYSMPLFLKWDDAEFGLRAGATGFGTVSLQGAAVWHESWRGKDDSTGWPAYFHARNRMITALLHAPASVRTGLLVANLALEVKQLLALRRFAVEVRHDGLRGVLAGPAALGRPFDIAALRARTATAEDQAPVPDAAAAPLARTVLAPLRAPTGAALAGWTAIWVLRHLLVPVRTGSPVRLPLARAKWWVLPALDDVLVPTSDGTAHVHLTRDRARFRTLLAETVRLHARLWLAWPSLRRRYRAAAPRLASPEAWAERFAEHPTA